MFRQPVSCLSVGKGLAYATRNALIFGRSVSSLSVNMVSASHRSATAVNMCLSVGQYVPVCLPQVRNGRTAMLAFLGFASQAVVTGKGPIQNLTDHLSDPTLNNGGVCVAQALDRILVVLRP
jgi:hypothetical protein